MSKIRVASIIPATPLAIVYARYVGRGDNGASGASKVWKCVEPSGLSFRKGEALHAAGHQLGAH